MVPAHKQAPETHLPAAFDALLRSNARKRTFARGAVAIPRGEPAPGLWCVQSGALAAMGRDLSGRELALAFRLPGEWFAETTLLDGRPSQYGFVATERTEALHVPHRVAEGLVATHPALREALVMLTCTRFRQVSRYVEAIIVPDLPARLAGHLLFLARTSPGGLQAGKALQLRLPQATLAELCGATREAVGRHLVRWQSAGWITLRYGKITLIDPDALRAVVSEGRTPPEPAPRSSGARKRSARAS